MKLLMWGNRLWKDKTLQFINEVIFYNTALFQKHSRQQERSYWNGLFISLFLVLFISWKIYRSSEFPSKGWRHHWPEVDFLSIYFTLNNENRVSRFPKICCFLYAYNVSWFSLLFYNTNTWDRKIKKFKCPSTEIWSCAI